MLKRGGLEIMSSKGSITVQDRKAITRLLDRLPMELEEFLTRYPDTSRQELADIADCSIDVVDHWFMEGASHRDPTKYHKLRFALYHWIATDGQSQPEVLNQLRDLHNQD